MLDCKKSQREFEALINKVTETPIKFKQANQIIDVRFYQGRKRHQWYARIDIGNETHRIGPASILAILANVGNFIRGEAAYADARVYGVENDDQD